MKKDLSIIFGLFLLIAVLIIFGQGFTSGSFLKNNGGVSQKSQKAKGFTTVNARSLSINAKIASLASDRKRGLSRRNSLPFNEGMLFVFENSGVWGFWMKDMKFAIDIIWIGDDKKIVDIATNVPPEPDKRDRELTIHRPRADAMYVLEVNAGLANLNGLAIGDKVDFAL